LDRDAVERIYPLRPAQQGMLFDELTAVGVSPYHRQVSFTLEGTVDEAACEAAWNSLLARHILLRSIFDYERTGRPLQIVLKNQTVEFGLEDLVGADAAARIAAWRQADTRRGFDLRRDRLMRVRLFRLGRDRFEMVWSHPHILLDGWSGAILREEFAAFYSAALRGAPLTLPPPIDPSAYLEALDARDPAAAVAHWAALLNGYDELATLPRSAGRDGPPRPVEHRFTIGERETAALFGLARRHDATLGVLLEALWGLLLGRWTGRRDVVFGIVVSGRSVATPDVERLVGMFINTVPVRVCWDGRQDFATLLRTLRLQGLEGIAHDHAALAEVQAASGLPKGLLDHVLVVENYPAGDAAAVGTGFAVAGFTTTEQASYDFGVMVHAGATLDFTLPHDASLFPPGLMARIEQQMRTLVAGLLGAPDAPLATLDPLPAGERQALVTWAAGPTVPSPTTATLADLWHAQADRTPDSIALVAGDHRLSYRTLDRVADGIAFRLSTEGLAAEEPVAVLAGRTADRIVALLGILKAGGVYLPLSTALPNERIAFMLKDARCRRVLVDPPGELRLSPLGPGLTRPIAGASASHRAPHVAPACHLAYIIYTSGSTGQPKGVAVEHRGFINMILAQIAGFGIRSDDAVMQFASCSFDASLSEIFMALLAGARLVMATDAAIRDGAALLALMAAEGVTVATLPPSYLGALEGASLGGLRVLITAGEPPNPRDARHYARQLRYFNAYGPSEASVCASWHEVDPDAPYAEGIPIGRPIANTKMMVLDSDGRTMMPIGAVGEICLAGPGLARGYIGQPVLTAERFPTIDGDRIYHTGDAGLLQPDGDVLYLGRRDEQVKLNGYRIELGEIESRLRHHPSVAQAAAVILEDPRRLVAYIVPRTQVDPEAVRLALAASLPPWAVPAAVIALPALPRTVAGKIDRRALAAPAPEGPPDATPLTPAEALVAEAFASVLGFRSFGRHSSFAASGGDSLRAIRLLGRLRRDGLSLDLKAMLGADTVSAIAAAAHQGNATEDHRLIIGTAPLTPIQRWFLQSHGIAQLNHLVLLRAVDRSLDPPALAAALDAAWRHHDALRFTYRHTADGWIQEGMAPDGPFAPRTIDLRDTADPWPTIAADAARIGFDPVGGPLFKATHYRLVCGDHLLLAAHHLVVDAASWRIIVEDLGASLRQAAAGQTIRCPGKTTAYRDWALALKDWSGGAAAARERPYWEMVAAADIAPPPADFERVSHGYGDTDIVTADLGPVHPDLPERRILARLLAALGAAMHRWDGRGAAQVLLSSHGRNPLSPGLDVSRTVGWFTAEFPFLLACESGVDAIEAALDAVPSNGLGWGVLRWLSGTPIMLPEPELSLNYMGSIDVLPDQAFALSHRLPNVSFGATERRRLIEAEASVVAGRLALGIRYAPRVHAAATARRLIDDIAGAFVVARNGPAESN
jgi:amino acid adenylation domain-containing protein/non-ribosomal peptide synthase protein (TIGR01720 family)